MKINNTQKCPYCAEYISNDACICPYCGETLIYKQRNIKLFAYMFIILTLLAFLLGGLFALLSINPNSNLNIFKTPDFMLKYGIFLYKKNKNDKSIEILQEIIGNKEYSKRSKAYYYIGKNYEKKKNIPYAIENYKKALTLDPQLTGLIVPLVKMCLNEKDISCTSNYIETAHKLAPNDTKILFYYATSIINDTHKTIPLMKEVIAKDSKNYLANKFVGYYYYSKNNYNKAISYLKKAYALKKTFKHDTGVEYVYDNIPEEEVMLVEMYINLNQYTNAMNILDTVIKETNDYTAINLKHSVQKQRDEYLYNKSIQKYRTEQIEKENKIRNSSMGTNGWDY